jgi:DNA-binding MarR family transcriptional regulator
MTGGEARHLLFWLEAAQRRTVEEVLATADPGTAEIGLRRLRILSLIPAAGTRQQDLAERAAVTKQAIAELLTALESDGLVLRRPDAHDRRAWQVTRTARGDRALRDLQVAITAAEARLAEELGPRRYSDLLGSLQRIGSADSTRR